MASEQTTETEKPLSRPLVLDNEGNAYSRNRAARRRRPPNDPWFTKATHKFKKIRKKHAEQERKRAASEARKARKSRNTKVS